MHELVVTRICILLPDRPHHRCLQERLGVGFRDGGQVDWFRCKFFSIGLCQCDQIIIKNSPN